MRVPNQIEQNGGPVNARFVRDVAREFGRKIGRAPSLTELGEVTGLHVWVLRGICRRERVKLADGRALKSEDRLAAQGIAPDARATVEQANTADNRTYAIERAEEFKQKIGRAPSLDELAKLTGIHVWVMRGIVRQTGIGLVDGRKHRRGPCPNEEWKRFSLSGEAKTREKAMQRTRDALGAPIAGRKKAKPDFSGWPTVAVVSCPVCTKRFTVRPREWPHYAVGTNRQVIYFCSYDCVRMGTRYEE